MRYFWLLALGALAPAMFLLLPVRHAAANPGDTVADRVFGQGGVFTTGSCNLGGISASSLCFAEGLAFDADGNLYVADNGNNRVLEFDQPLTTDLVADQVFGQNGSFTSDTCNLGGLGASSLCEPDSVAVDAAGNLYVADGGNSRVLEYVDPLHTDMVADLVLGQGGSFASSTCNLGGVGASSLCFADGLTLDAAGNLYVADFSNNRVLEFDDPLNTDTVADLVFGQGGSFASDLCNSGGRSADSMCGPSSLGVDGAGNLYVPDLGNNRVLEFDDPLNTDTVADLVLGQSGSFATSHCNLGGVNASSLCGPEGVAVDGAGDLYVADEDNNRVLEYNDPLNTDSVADRVFGQGGFNTGGGGTGASRLHQPFGVTVDDSGNLYILDTGNSRVLEYDDPHASAPPTATSNALGGLVKLVVPSASRDTNEGTIWAFGAAGLLLIVAGGAYAWRRVRRE